METLLKSTFPIFTRNPNIPITKRIKTSKVSIKPPPPEFDFRSEILQESRAMVAKIHPELLDLTYTGSLVVIEKRLFGPVPAWRTEFVEPEAIWLLGTTHISTESAAEVERVVRAVKPDNVVVELCRSRRPNSSSFTSPFSTFLAKLSSNANRPFGDEFRAARKMSEEVGAQIVLGDRPIEITLERAWNALNWSEKLNLVILVIRGITSSSDTSKNNLKVSSDSGSFELYQKLSFSYPSLLQPLIHERDTYLAWSLKRSKAVNSSKRVVGVIGKGHMNGVIYALISDQGNLRFRDLVGKRPYSGDGSNYNSLVDDIVKSLVRDTAIGVLLWELYQFFKAPL